ncbi:MAG TPA: transposase [Fimbriimonadaceae bacterium]|nr:transposase [Fimbriimonadaceae bacterium]
MTKEDGDPAFDRAVRALDSQEPGITVGSCILANPEVAEAVSEAINFGRGERQLLHAWCVMPNHVHIVASLMGGVSLPQYTHSIKSYTAHKINAMLSTTGTVWERESFDHVIRTAEQFAWFCEYTEQNPVKSGQCATASDWLYGSAHPSRTVDPLTGWIDPRKTPFARIRSRGELPHLEKCAATYFLTFRLRDAVRPKPGS